MSESAVKVEIENLSEVKRKTLIEVPADEVNAEIDQAYGSWANGPRSRVSGQGRCPAGPGDVLSQADRARGLRRPGARSLGEALKEKDLEAVNMSWPEPPPAPAAGQDYRFSVELEVMPEFTAADYLGLEISARPWR